MSISEIVEISSDADLEMAEKETKRRVSIFNRTESVPANYTTIDYAENRDLEEYCRKLDEENNLWKEILNETKKENADLKRSLKSDLTEQFEFDNLTDNQKKVILSRPNYSAYLNKAVDICNQVSLMAVRKRNLESIQEYQIKSMQDQINAIM